MSIRYLGLVLGDQLDENASLFDELDPKKDAIWMAEAEEESTKVWSHKARIAVFLSAMRHFKTVLKNKGFKIIYHSLEEGARHFSLADRLKVTLRKTQPKKVFVVEPGEFHVQEALKKTLAEFKIPLFILPDRHFIISKKEFIAHAEERKSLRMEYFYRMVRKKTGILMEGDKPRGGAWNFDEKNRNNFGKEGPGFLPKPPSFPPDKITKEVIRLVEKKFPKHPGSLALFSWPVTRKDALRALDDFILNRLPLFGQYQDAMWVEEPFLYHSLLSSALNLKLIHPLEVVQKAEKALARKDVPLSSVEGFIRQIIGWREYVRGVYWRFMPEYVNRNALDAKENLPGFYWTGETEMNCLRRSLRQTLDWGYAHHIQRLMVTGLFSLLYGIDPKQIHEWYLAVYVDAVEWVEAPNTIGMSQYADGGVMGSKPYVATGKYIQRMSNYCSGCRFDPEKRTGENACPFTTFYWDFLMKHEKDLSKNNRMGMQLRNLKRLSQGEKTKIKKQAQSLRKGMKEG